MYISITLSNNAQLLYACISSDENKQLFMSEPTFDCWL